ncbi:MAG: ABC transporter permease [Anaerolineales bacterium]|nr:ABC transporter permease [Anaerolineales bacterium]MCB9129230.1 ABC transporter permease [Ardenticatenales bacterium]
MLNYITRYPDRVWGYFLDHVQLTVLALAIALLIALPIGLWLSRNKRAQGPVLGLLSILYTIPSLALFVILVPLVGLGTINAVTALVIYAQVVLVRNIVTGLEGVPESVLEAGRGMGMSGAQLFRQVELPLALPVIIVGLRVATLSTIGIGTIAALVGAGGLGRLLFDGVQQNNSGKIWAGALAVSLLAIAINALLRRAESYAGRATHLNEKR